MRVRILPHRGISAILGARHKSPQIKGAPMAATDINTVSAPKLSVFAAITSPFRAFWNGLIRMAETNARVKQIEILSNMSDEQFKAAGTTREAELNRLLASFGGL